MLLEEISSSVSSESVANNNNNAIVGVSGQNDFEDDSRFRRDRYCSAPVTSSTVIVDTDDYRRVLKNKLETECAKVVSLMVGSVKIRLALRILLVLEKLSFNQLNLVLFLKVL